MVKIFKKKISNSFFSRISIYNEKWENWDGDKRDGLICIHSIYPMSDHRNAVLKMLKYGNILKIILNDFIIYYLIVYKL